MSGSNTGAALSDIADALLRRAKAAGADAADAVVARGEALSVAARRGALEHVERDETLDFSLRVLIDAAEDGRTGRRLAVVSASDPAPETLDALAERAVALAREAPLDPYARLATPDELTRDAPDLGLDDPSPPPAPDALLEDALALEAAMLETAEVRQADRAAAGWSQSERFLAASNGFARGYASGVRSRVAGAVAGEGLGMERDYAYSAARRAADLRGAEAIGREAAARAVARLGPQSPPSGATPVVFEARAARSWVAALLGALNGAAHARGSSFLRDRLGERVLPAGVDLIDDPLIPLGLGSRPFDGEGLAGARRKLIADGVASELLLDLSSAAQLGRAPNGCASRGVGSGPSPGAGNAWLTPGDVSLDALLAETGRCALITRTMGGGVNGVTGDYSAGVSGVWVENGAPTRPFNEATLAGDALEMLRSLTAADDITDDGSVNAPSLRMEGVTLAAK